jgi:hypothetical protein
MEASEVRATLEAEWPELAAMLSEHDADPVASGLEYLEMAAIARFLAERLRAGDSDQFEAFFEAVERCMLQGSHEAVTLVTVGLLESLQNSNVTRLDANVWRPHLRPRTSDAWEGLNAFWRDEGGRSPDSMPNR